MIKVFNMAKVFNIITRLFTNNKVQKKIMSIQTLTLAEYLEQNISDYSEEFGDIYIIEPYTLEKCHIQYKDGYITEESKKIWSTFFEHYNGYYVMKSNVDSSVSNPKIVNYTIEIAKDPKNFYNSYEFTGLVI